MQMIIAIFRGLRDTGYETAYPAGARGEPEASSYPVHTRALDDSPVHHRQPYHERHATRNNATNFSVHSSTRDDQYASSDYFERDVVSAIMFL